MMTHSVLYDTSRDVICEWNLFFNLLPVLQEWGAAILVLLREKRLGWIGLALLVLYIVLHKCCASYTADSAVGHIFTPGLVNFFQSFALMSSKSFIYNCN